MTVRSDVQQLKPLEIVTLFTFDATPIGDPTVLNWHSGRSTSNQPIVWQGVTYEPYPIEASDFEITATGTLPRPKLRGSNIGGLLGDLVRSMKDGLGAKIIRKRTLGRYLDAVNFPGVGNPYADPNTHFPDEIFYIARKSSENPIFVEVELAVRFDVAGVKLPRRQVIATTCQWVYRSPECSYAGPPVQDVYGNATGSMAFDRCRKTLDACRARFGTFGVLRTSAFPASLLVRQ